MKNIIFKECVKLPNKCYITHSELLSCLETSKQRLFYLKKSRGFPKSLVECGNYNPVYNVHEIVQFFDTNGQKYDFFEPEKPSMELKTIITHCLKQLKFEKSSKHYKDKKITNIEITGDPREPVKFHYNSNGCKVGEL